LNTCSSNFLQKLRTLNAELAGNSNTHSKIKYMKQLKEENNKLMSDNRKMAKLLNAQSGKNGEFYFHHIVIKIYGSLQRAGFF
jgi:hypothetical protein